MADIFSVMLCVIDLVENVNANLYNNDAHGELGRCNWVNVTELVQSADLLSMWTKAADAYCIALIILILRRDRYVLVRFQSNWLMKSYYLYKNFDFPKCDEISIGFY